MSGSPHVARIKADVLRIIDSVPPGHVVSFADIGAHLDVMPRHVAYILATLDEMERATQPWWRAVGKAGPKAEQKALLATDGSAVPVAVADLPHGVPKQTRPAIRLAARPRARRAR